MASPANASCWKTLGVAQYRAGEWRAAIDTLKKADRMTTDGDLYHHFFLAMAHWRAGNQELARKCYDEANMWMEEYQPQDVELRAFREEAAELLNTDDRPSAKATTQPESKTTRPRSGR
jgi:hypothetical protein